MAFLSLFTTVLDWVNFPIYPVASELERFLAAIIGGIAQGLTGLMLRVGGSAGGVDVIACMIQKKRQSDNVEKIIALLSYVIALFSFFVWQGDVNAVIYSFVAIYAGEKMTAMVLKDSRSAVKFEIIVAKENAEKIKTARLVLDCFRHYKIVTGTKVVDLETGNFIRVFINKLISDVKEEMEDLLQSKSPALDTEAN